MSIVPAIDCNCVLAVGVSTKIPIKNSFRSVHIRVVSLARAFSAIDFYCFHLKKKIELQTSSKY